MAFCLFVCAFVFAWFLIAGAGAGPLFHIVESDEQMLDPSWDRAAAKAQAEEDYERDPSLWNLYGLTPRHPTIAKHKKRNKAISALGCLWCVCSAPIAYYGIGHGAIAAFAYYAPGFTNPAERVLTKEEIAALGALELEVGTRVSVLEGLQVSAARDLAGELREMLGAVKDLQSEVVKKKSLIADLKSMEQGTVAKIDNLNAVIDSVVSRHEERVRAAHTELAAIMSLREEQVRAAASLIKDAEGVDRYVSFWISTAFSFVLGVLANFATTGISWFLRRRRRSALAAQGAPDAPPEESAPEVSRQSDSP
jgi:hypothetical protein